VKGESPASVTKPSRSLERYLGCVLGLATGDALGAPHEGGPAERMLWRLIGKTPSGCFRWTDDTQMSLDLAESLLSRGDLNPTDLAQRFAASYRWSRGYGPGTARVLRRLRRGEPWQEAALAGHAGGSLGNGAAMRAPILALFFPDDDRAVIESARTSARVTHAHPLGIEGALIIGVAAHALLNDISANETLDAVRRSVASPEMSSRLETAQGWLTSGNPPEPPDVVRDLGNGASAPASCPTALYIAIRFLTEPFEEMLRFVIKCRGDVDTIAAMAGALWGVANGNDRLPDIRLEAREHLEDVAVRLYEARS